MDFGGGGGSGLSIQESNLLDAQTAALQLNTEIVTQQLKTQELLAPLLFEELGVEPIINEQGETTGFRRVDDPIREQRERVESLTLSRTEAALKGELPVNTALLADLRERESTLRERLRKQFGPGFETGSPGIETLGKFFEGRQGVLEAARRGDLLSASQLLSTLGNTQQQDFTNLLQGIGGIESLTLGGVQALSGVSSGGTGLFDALSSSRNQAANRESQEGAATVSAITAAIGIAAGIAASSEELKENIEDVDEDKLLSGLDSLPIKRWSYKEDTPFFDGMRHVGPMAEDFSDTFGVGDGKNLHLVDVMGVLMGTQKAMSRKIEAFVNG